MLEALDLTPNKLLEEVTLGKNKLASLDIRGLSALATIELTANKIDRLDLHGCTALDELHMSENLVDYITFYGCTALRYVDIRNNKVKSLDFSANEKMNFLFATQNPELTTVFIKEGANYSTIDVDSSVTIYTKSGDDFSEVGGNWGDGDVDPWKK